MQNQKEIKEEIRKEYYQGQDYYKKIKKNIKDTPK